MTNLDVINYIFEPIFGTKPFIEAENAKVVNKPRFANVVRMPEVKRVVFSNDVTLVYFKDDTCSIVRKTDSDEYNREHAIVYAIVKRAYGKIDPNTGIVKGNGRMGNMLAKLLDNAIDQGALIAAKKAKKEAKKEAAVKKQQRVAKIAALATAEKQNVAPATEERETVKPWAKPAGGRFAKKSNRN